MASEGDYCRLKWLTVVSIAADHGVTAFVVSWPAESAVEVDMGSDVNVPIDPIDAGSTRHPWTGAQVDDITEHTLAVTSGGIGSA